MRILRLWILLLATCVCGCGSPETDAPSTEATGSNPVAESKPQPPEWKVRGEALLQSEKSAEAIALYDAALHRSPGDVEILLSRAKAKQYAGDFLGAQRDCEAVLKLSPGNGRAWFGKANGLMGQQDYPGAIAALDKAIEFGSRDYLTYHTRGVARQMAGQLHEALADFTEAIQLDPNNTDGRVERGYVYASLGEHEKAIADFTAHIEADPSDARALNFRAASYSAMGDKQRELADIKEAMRRNPDEPQYPCYLGIVSADNRDFVEAVKWLSKAVEIDQRIRNVNVPAIEPKELTTEDLAFGRSQVAQLIHDRPVLQKHVKENDMLHDWLVRQFAGASAGVRCRWNPEKPNRFLGLTSVPMDGVGTIQVAEFEPGDTATEIARSFEEVISTVVFECFNHAGHLGFDANWQRILKGEIDPSTYARLSLEAEDVTAIRTRRFFCTIYMNWATEANYTEANPRNWCFDYFLPSDAIWRNVAHYRDLRWDHYLEGGIASFSHGAFQRGGLTAAIKYLDSELARPEYSTAIQARIHFFRASYLNQSGDQKAELVALNDSIRLDPTFAKAYFARAEALQYANQAESELADLAKGLELDPRAAWAHVRRAEILVLSDEAAIRNGKAAIENATKACEHTKWEDVSPILMLAAGHAEAGNRDEAVKWQKKAAEMSPAESRGPVEAVIPIYAAGKTLRDAPLPPQPDEPPGGESGPMK